MEINGLVEFLKCPDCRASFDIVRFDITCGRFKADCFEYGGKVYDAKGDCPICGSDLNILVDSKHELSN